jgi:hypothetical protein
MEKEIKGTFNYDQDSKRYHRYKDADRIPDKIVLDKVVED